MPEKRQHDINIGGRLLIVRWTLGALDEVETMLNGSLLEWMRVCITLGFQKARVTHVARIIHAGAVGGMGRAAPSAEEVFELIVAEGLPQVVEKLLEVLAPFVATPDAIKRHMEDAEAGKSPAPDASS